MVLPSLESCELEGLPQSICDKMKAGRVLVGTKIAHDGLLTRRFYVCASSEEVCDCLSTVFPLVGTFCGTFQITLLDLPLLLLLLAESFWLFDLQHIDMSDRCSTRSKPNRCNAGVYGLQDMTAPYNVNQQRVHLRGCRL